jgi:glycogen(starch) synthase
MRVLFLCEAFWPAIGGVETRARHFVPAMRNRGHELLVVTTREADGALPETDQFAGVPIHRLTLRAAFERNDFTQIVAVKRQYAQIRAAFAPDLVHCFFSGMITLLEASVELAPPAPLLASFTTWPFEAGGKPAALFGRLLHRAAWVTTNSARLRDTMAALAPGIVERSSVVLSGNPWPDRDPEPLPFHPPVLLCIGRVVETKGFDLAIQALARLSPMIPGISLQIAGDGPARGACAALAESLGITARVAFLGWVHPDRISALINDATIVIVPSRWEEAFASVVIHAAQMARPVIATDCGGMAEAVADGETGLLVPREDAAAIAGAVLRLLNDMPATVAMGERARRRAAELHSWPAYLDAFDDLYRRLGSRPVPDQPGKNSA